MRNWDLNNQIVLNVILYLETKDEVLKQDILSDLKLMAKYYSVSIKKVSKIRTMEALKQFLANKQGKQIHLSKLYYSL